MIESCNTLHNQCTLLSIRKCLKEYLICCSICDEFEICSKPCNQYLGAIGDERYEFIEAN